MSNEEIKDIEFPPDPLLAGTVKVTFPTEQHPTPEQAMQEPAISYKQEITPQVQENKHITEHHHYVTNHKITKISHLLKTSGLDTQQQKKVLDEIKSILTS